MNVINCKSVRRELDELNLDQQLTGEAARHLSSCRECRHYGDEHRALRGLIASLATVNAPADFDFRLRARLAREKDSRSSYLNRSTLWSSFRPIAAAAMVVLITVAGILVKNWTSAKDKIVANGPSATKPQSVLASGGSHPQQSPQPPDKGQLLAVGQKNNNSESTHRSGVGSRGNITERTSNVGGQRNSGSAVKEFSGAPAPVYERNDSALLRVQIDGQPFKLSVDDGRGGERTISIPSVTFGSQRVLARTASFAPASSGRGVW